jgi:hypothetical protein
VEHKDPTVRVVETLLLRDCPHKRAVFARFDIEPIFSSSRAGKELPNSFSDLFFPVTIDGVNKIEAQWSESASTMGGAVEYQPHPMIPEDARH